MTTNLGTTGKRRTYHKGNGKGDGEGDGEGVGGDGGVGIEGRLSKMERKGGKEEVVI